MSSGLCPFLNVQGLATTGPDIWQDRRTSRALNNIKKKIVTTTRADEEIDRGYTIVSGSKDR